MNANIIIGILIVLFFGIVGVEAREAGQTEYEMGIDFENLGRKREAKKWFQDSAEQGYSQAIAKLEVLRKQELERKKRLRKQRALAKNRKPKIIHVLKDGDLRLPNGEIFRTGIYETKLIAQLSYDEERPFFVFSGRGCTECDMKQSIYVHSPGDGALEGAMAPRYPFPGQVYYHEDQSLIFESKMFFGNCEDHPNEMVVWFIRNKNLEGVWEKKILKVTINDGNKQEDLLEELTPAQLEPLLQSVKLGICHELPGIKQTSEP